MIDHVLSPFSDRERELLDPLLDTAVDAVIATLCAGAAAAMNLFNGKSVFKLS